MSNTSVKVAIALFLVLVSPAASFARGGGGVQGGGTVGMGPSGGAAGARPNPATLGAMQNMQVDPSGIGNASKVAPIPPPRITVPTVPQFK
jgi:hypothetical protein